MKKSIWFLIPVFLFTNPLFAQQICLKGDCKTGYGEASYADSSTYKGGFVKGMREGHGIYERKNNIYTGGWKDGDYDGEGKESIKKIVNGKYVVQEEFIGTYNRFDFIKGLHVFYGPNGITDTLLVISGNYHKGIIYGEATMTRKKDPKWTVYSNNWTDNRNFSKGMSLDTKGKSLGNYKYVDGIFSPFNATDETMAEKGASANASGSSSVNGSRFKTLYFHKANSTIIRQNVFQSELVNTVSSPKTGTININTQNSTITISVNGEGDKVYKIVSVGDEVTDQYGGQTITINCSDESGISCKAIIGKEYAFTTSNEMHLYITYSNGTGKGYTCDFISSVYQN
jgi:hypothetical protein